MPSIEIRRHSLTKKGAARGKGSHLSAQGVQLARAIGETIGPFDLVLTSPSPRTLETAVAMGFAVDDHVDALGDISEDVVEELGHHERWTWDEPFVRFADFVARGGPTARLGQRQREAWIAALESVPLDGAVLIVSHGRVIEAGLVTCLPDENFASWGLPFRHCEGVRLEYGRGQFKGYQLLRV